MFKILNVFHFIGIISCVFATYNGPFILWGRDELKNVDVSALEGLDDKFLRNIYAESPAIILFVRNASNRLSDENFPTFKNLLQKNKYVYLTQHWLPSDPVDYNVNAEVINLVGPASQQDVELSALYKDAVVTYGDGKVLGILATKTSDHEMRKRAVEDSAASTESSVSTTESPLDIPYIESPDSDRDFIYYPNNKNQTFNILMHTRKPPLLINGSSRNYLGDNKTMITIDRRNQTNYILKVRYNNEPGKLSVEYIFNIGANGYWTLIAAEVGNGTKLDVVGEKPSAPIGFSYKCSKPVIFRNGSVILELKNIQVQPGVKGKRFSEAYNCVGFTTAPIWSGVFVSLVICFVVAIGINCIMEIKPPNRFENSRNKQLTFTISE